MRSACCWKLSADYQVMENDPAKPAPRRPVLQGLDAKALLAAGLEAESLSGELSPEPAVKANSRRVFVIGAAAVVLATAGGILLRRQPVEGGDLLAGVELSSALQRGEWRKVDGALQSVRDDQPSLVALPVAGELGASYDLIFQFTRLSGEKSVALFFRTAQGMGSLEFDAWEQPGLCGVQMFDGHDLRQEGAFSFPLLNGRSYEFLLQVRPDAVHVLHQDQVLHSYPLTGRRLEVTSPWGWAGEWQASDLVLGSWHSVVSFQKLALRRHQG